MSSAAGASPKDGEKSLAKLFDLIDAVAAAPHGISGRELAVATGIASSTAFRMLKFLVDRQVLCRRDGLYLLDFGVVRLGRAAAVQHPLLETVRPVLAKLAASTLETVHLARLADRAVFYIDKVDGTRPVRMASLIGSTGPLYCTGVGKAMLAFLAPKRRAEICAALELKRFTPSTVTDPERFAAELDRVRRCGYAVDDCEHEPGVYCVAAPLLDGSSHAVAGISVSGSEFYLRSRTVEIAKLVTAAANELSERIGGAFDW